MILARIVGTVVATRKDQRLVGHKLLVARPMDPKGKSEGAYLVAVDTVDAGVGESVLIVSGSSARMAAGMKDCPVDAAVVGIPHKILGEEVGAVVQLKPGMHVTEDELRAHAASHLAAFKVPVKVLFMTEPLPRNANGKILKPVLREQFVS